MIKFQDKINEFEKKICSTCNKKNCKRRIIIKEYKRETSINCFEYERGGE